jgi:hypothetical protein
VLIFAQASPPELVPAVTGYGPASQFDGGVALETMKPSGTSLAGATGCVVVVPWVSPGLSGVTSPGVVVLVALVPVPVPVDPDPGLCVAGTVVVVALAPSLPADDDRLSDVEQEARSKTVKPRVM